jgi:GlpG protein
MVDPSYPIHMVPMNVVLMLGWLVACMTPLIPNVANGAHLGGLLAGMLAALVGRAIRR